MLQQLEEDVRLVSALKEGTVIDHIPCGEAFKIVSLLKLYGGKQRATIGLSLSSKRMGCKDLVKVENRILTEHEIAEVAIFAPQATINLIHNFRIEKKCKAMLPSLVKRILLCPNQKCITRKETVDSLFLVEEFKSRVHLRCIYCEKLFEQKEITEYRIDK